MRFSDTPSCDGMDINLFFVEKRGDDYESLDYIRKMCKNCPVLEECFKYAITYNVRGVWAGTTEPMPLVNNTPSVWDSVIQNIRAVDTEYPEKLLELS